VAQFKKDPAIMIDYWELKKIFRFSNVISRIYNDTDKVVKEIDLTGKSYEVKPKSRIILGLNKPEDDYIIRNLDILNHSNRQIYIASSIKDNLNQIILRYTNSIKRGQIIEAIKFLEYHYNYTKNKKGLLRFVKYYILSKTWMTEGFRKNYTINDDEIENWIKKKERFRKNIIYFIILGVLIITIALLGILFCVDYKIIVGAILGALLTQIGKLIDKIIP